MMEASEGDLEDEYTSNGTYTKYIVKTFAPQAFIVLIIDMMKKIIKTT